ncbi:MAG: hypothetical protein JO353_05720 [Phycisphaerae bacterium]|nr:hypothetical protein [Phycisphaerae bacterium]
MRAFTDEEAMLVVEDANTLLEAVVVLLSTPEEAAAMGRRAQDVVRTHQGATERHVDKILEILPTGGVLADAIG